MCSSVMGRLLAAALLLAGLAACGEGMPLAYPYCSSLLEPRAQRYCLAYINSATSNGKWLTATAWSKFRRSSFQCANITALCLLSDMRSEAYGSACSTAANGSPCTLEGGGPGSCFVGLCNDPSEVAVNMMLVQDGADPGLLAVQQAASRKRSAQQQPGPAAPAPAAGGGADPDEYSYDYGDPTLPSGGVGGPGGGSAAPRTQTPGTAQAPGGAVAPAVPGVPAVPGAPAVPPGTAVPPAVDDPYGLGIELPSNPKIDQPFLEPSPPPPRPPPPPPPAVQKRAQLTMDIQPDAFNGTIPPSFVGISREWTPAVFWDRNMDAFGRIFAELGPSPILRIGGATQEALLKAPNSTYMDSLVRMHCMWGVRYIIGLPLFQFAPQLSLAVKAAFDEAFKAFPYAILSYELGNEPNYWPTRQGGFKEENGPTTCVPVGYNDPAYQLVGTMATNTDKPGGGGDGYALYRDYAAPYVPYKASQYCYTPKTLLFLQGTDPNYLTYFQNSARALTGCGGIQTPMQAAWGEPYWGPPGFNRRVISGPGWGDFKTMSIQEFRKFLEGSDMCYLSEATMHLYGPNRNTTFEALFGNLLGAPPSAPDQTQRPYISIIRDYVDAAKAANVSLRVSEANSVPDGGQSNLSNTLGAALWTIVASLELARAGASGVNYHWGNGGTPPDPGRAPAYIGVQTLFEDKDWNRPYPAARGPWYGYVLLSRALGRNGPGILLNYSSNAAAFGTCADYFYAYPILVPHAGMISVVVANANRNVTCDFTATLPGVVMSGATLQRLLGPKGLESVPGITLAGQTYEKTKDGRMDGTYSPEIIQPHMETIRTTGWTFAVPAGSGALLQIPLSGGATNQLGAAPVTPNLVPGGTQQAAPIDSAPFTQPVGVEFPATQLPPDAAIAASGPRAPAAAQQQPPGAGAAPSSVPGAGAAPGGVPGAGGQQLNEADVGPNPAELAAGPDLSQMGAGSYVLKGYTDAGRPIYSWQPAAGSSYGSDAAAPAKPESGRARSGFFGGLLGGRGGSKQAVAASSSGGGGSKQQQQATNSGASKQQAKAGGNGKQPAPGSKQPAAPSGGLWGLLGFGGGARKAASGATRALLNYAGYGSGGDGIVGGVGWSGSYGGGGGVSYMPSSGGSYLAAGGTSGYSSGATSYVPGSASYTYTPGATNIAVVPGQQPVAASAASAYGLPSPSGIGRAWPQAVTSSSNLDVGEYGLGGYTLLPPGYDANLVRSTAAQCPGIARILQIQAQAGVNRR